MRLLQEKEEYVPLLPDIYGLNKYLCSQFAVSPCAEEFVQQCPKTLIVDPGDSEEMPDNRCSNCIEFGNDCTHEEVAKA